MKYKTNIKDVTFPDEWLDHMRPVTFNSTSDYDDPDQTIVGLIAEDMHNATDQHRLFVDYVDGEPDAIGYDRLVVPLISIVRDLRDRIIALENRG